MNQSTDFAMVRRGFLGLSAAVMGPALAMGATSPGRIVLPRINAATEQPLAEKPLPLADKDKVGYALVGLGHLTLNQLLPAFGKSLLSRPVALVSGDRGKATKVAEAHGIKPSSIYDYDGFDRIVNDPAIKVVYIVLPNSMHCEFTVRALKAGKHVLCEKPMANSVGECRQMIDAAKAANRKLMIAYRSQYEPADRAILKMVKDKRLGDLRMFSAYNVQNEGDPGHWRHKLAMAGGGALPDVGIYCLNAARFMSGEEPVEVSGQMYSTPGDPRFAEVEESIQFMLRFPSGLVAQCGAGYSGHESKALRLMGSLGWAELDPAFGYTGIKLRVGEVVNGKNVVSEPSVEESDQFALEMDHMSRCVLDDVVPHTPGEEGLQDMRIVEAIYASAREGRRKSLEAMTGSTRGPEPAQT